MQGNLTEFDINYELKKLPDLPGVYIMYDKDDNIIYVGKSVSLKNRVRSYFTTNHKYKKVQAMVEHIHRFEYIIVNNETESLVLEANLIKKNRPKYNINLKDDKQYPYIKITNEKFPKIPNSFIPVTCTASSLYQIVPEAITVLKNTVMNSLPTMAGLNLFLPSPLYMSFPNIIAIAPPNATT